MKKNSSTESAHNRAYRRRHLKPNKVSTGVYGSVADPKSVHQDNDDAKFAVTLGIFVVVLSAVAVAVVLAGGAV